jgi:flagellum-specific peptidoglycan hydrolase FlgJ
MKDLPMFDPSEKIEITPSVDLQSGAADLINSFQSFANTATSLGERKIILQNQQEKATLRTMVAQNYQNIAQDVLSEPNQINAVDDYNKRTELFNNQTVNMVEDKFKPYTRQLVNYYQLKHRTPIFNNALKQAERIRTSQFMENQSTLTESRRNAITESSPAQGEKQFENGLTLAGEQIRDIQDGITNGAITPIQGEKAINEIKRDTSIGVFAKQLSDAYDRNPSDAQKLVQNAMTQGIPHYSIKESVSLANTLNDRYRALHLQQIGLSKEQLTKKLEHNVTAIRETGSLANANDDALVSAIDPAKLPEYEAAKRQAFSDYQVAKAATHMDADSFERLKTQTRPREDSPDFPDALNRWQTSMQYAQKMRKSMFDDPVLFFQDHPYIEEQQNNYRLAKDSGTLTDWNPNAPVNQPLEHPDDAMANLQSMVGLSVVGKNTVKFLTKDNARNQVALLNNASMKQTMDYWKKIKEEHPNPVYRNLLVKQLAENGLNPGQQFLANFPDNDPDVQNVYTALTANGAEIFKNAKATGLNEQLFANELRQVINGNSSNSKYNAYIQALQQSPTRDNIDTMNQQIGLIKNLASYYYLTGQENSEDGAINHALKNLSGHFETVTMRGKSLLVPNQYDGKQVATYLEDVRKNNLEDFPFVTKALPEGVDRGLREANDREMIRNGYFDTAPGMQGAVWKDANGLMRTDNNGQPLFVPFQDADLNVPFRTTNDAMQATMDYRQTFDQPENIFPAVPDPVEESNERQTVEEPQSLPDAMQESMPQTTEGADAIVEATEGADTMQPQVMTKEELAGQDKEFRGDFGRAVDEPDDAPDAVEGADATVQDTEGPDSRVMQNPRVFPRTINEAKQITVRQLGTTPHQRVRTVKQIARLMYPDKPIMADLMTAQAVLESRLRGTPSSLAFKNNLFGIKGAGTAGRTFKWTNEHLNGRDVRVKDFFAANKTLLDSFEQYKRLLTHKRYKKVLAANTFQEAATEISKAAYATDPRYTRELISVWRQMVRNR